MPNPLPDICCTSIQRDRLTCHTNWYRFLMVHLESECNCRSILHCHHDTTPLGGGGGGVKTNTIELGFA